MKTRTCKYCKKHFEGYSDDHVERLMNVHLITKHKGEWEKDIGKQAVAEYKEKEQGGEIDGGSGQRERINENIDPVQM